MPVTCSIPVGSACTTLTGGYPKDRILLLGEGLAMLERIKVRGLGCRVAKCRTSVLWMPGTPHPPRYLASCGLLLKLLSPKPSTLKP